MTSVLNVDTIAAKDGTSPVGLTKQKAILVCVGFNMHGSTTYYGAGNNTAFTECFNTSSFNDSGTGQLETSLTNSLANTQFVITGMAVATNNNISHETDSTTSVVKTRGTDADSNAAQDNVQYFHVTGSLA
jgi:hypothetical protein